MSGVEHLPHRPRTVAEEIKDYILANRLSPGDPMPTENELSERLGVSRSRVREAVKTLSALDIIEVRHGHGTYVGQLSLTAMVESLAFRGMLNATDDLHVLADLIDIRQLMEVSLADVIIAGLTPQAALTLRRITSVMAEKAARGEEFVAEDRQFHLLLAQTTGNMLAVQLVGAFWDVHTIVAGPLSAKPDLLPATAAAHAAIVDAVERADPEELRAAIRAHYFPIRNRMLAEAAAARAG